MQTLLAQVLCHGVSPDGDVLASWKEYAYLDEGFIHGVTLRIANQHLANTAIFDQMVDPQHALRVRHLDGANYLHFEGEFVPCEVVPQPQAVFDSVGDYVVGKYVRLHGPQTVFLTPVRECIFIRMGAGCQFCTFEGSKPQPLPFEVLEEMVGCSPPSPISSCLWQSSPCLR